MKKLIALLLLLVPISLFSQNIDIEWLRAINSPEEPSFPSGHTSTAFATATALSLQFPKWYVIAPSFVYAGTVGYSRMHLGVHYPSDVLVGALIGSGCAFLSHKVNKKLNGNSNKHSR